MKYEHINILKEQAFRAVTGATKETFAKMTEILKKEYGIVHENHA